MAVKRVRLPASCSSAELEKVRAEFDLMAGLHHPHIVAYLGAEIEADTVNIFSEWVPGGALTSILKKFGPLSVAVVRRYTKQISAGLGYLHSQAQPVAHLDVKCANLLLDQSGGVKLCDFVRARGRVA